ncbi:PRC-barrel domain containing protein [Pedobacter frigiditerrae]|uniref:PRC-barrel domain containing protein n=1 Tax=Pedobacter frigiditerrae TaxID=2530452 RepID=A0A4V2MHW7_9SPHI|nr:PRC-barrel domain-containing protein [Pedobacter frigiditerrae]TCC88066.1 PRC-barrel domain containing protein [Pedobacter frigiditerrae]
MEQEQHTYRYLQELNGSDYQIVDGEPNIIGWEVKSEANAYLGKIKDLLFDPQTNAVRYLIIDLTHNGMNLEDKKVMIPIGIANLHVSADEVTLPNVHMEQFNALPAYEKDEIGPATEVNIRSIIGSPAALRIEESISEFDQNQFYTHHHFDKDKFYQGRRSSESLTSQEIDGTASMAGREEEKNTIHQMVENSYQNDLHAADEQTGVNTHHNEHKAINDDEEHEETDRTKPPYQ